MSNPDSSRSDSSRSDATRPVPNDGIDDRVDNRIGERVNDRVDDRIDNRIDDRVDTRLGDRVDTPTKVTRVDEPVTARAAAHGQTTREEVLEREKARFGGIKFGSAFFGWLTATGTAVLLTAVLTAIGVAVGQSQGIDAGDVNDTASQNAGTIGLVGAIALGVILLISYYCGGYVAGRMARFDGVKQGVAVWLWAIIIAVVVAIVGLIAGTQTNILSNLNGLPIPTSGSDLTATSILTAVGALVISLVGAILGGLAGMRFHRRVDREGLGR